MHASSNSNNSNSEDHKEKGREKKTKGGNVSSRPALQAGKQRVGVHGWVSDKVKRSHSAKTMSSNCLS